MQVATTIMQGDQYALPVEILTADGTLATEDTFADVEVVVGPLCKTASAGEITYSEEHEAFLFPLTQEDTLSLRDMPQDMQLRVKTQEGEVFGVKLGRVVVESSLSEEVL